MVSVTTLVENTAGHLGVLGEHGLAYWLEVGPHKLLFDTGQGMALLHNAEQLGARLDQAQAVILSHGHYDHTGGLADVLDVIGPTKVYAHPAAFRPKYARINEDTSRFIGTSGGEDVLGQAAELVPTEGPTEVVEGVFVTGEVPRVSGFEDVGGPFFVDEACRQPDPMQDDQSLFFTCAQGIVVLLGCAHAGVVNTLDYIHKITGGKPIHAVIGGMHLVMASQERIRCTIDALRGFDVGMLGPMHCTGMSATVELWKALPERCIACPAGTVLRFESPDA